MYEQQAALLNCFPHIRYFQNSWVKESMRADAYFDPNQINFVFKFPDQSQ